MRNHPRRRQIEAAVRSFERANRRSYYFCACGAEFRKGERAEYYAHKRRCEPKEKPKPQPAQLRLFGG